MVYADYSNVSAYGAAGGGNATCNIAAISGKAICVYSIIANSDLASSIITLKKGAAAGVTTSYTVVETITNPSAVNVNIYKSDGWYPLYIFPVGYEAQFLLSSTTANAMNIIYEMK